MTSRNRRSDAAGFTLVELLTVIGIIVLLIGILLPVLSAIRKAAWETDSQAAIMNLASAIERYRQDFNAYPGPIGNGTSAPPTEFQTANGTNATRGGMTMSENLLLGLAGGWEPTGATSAYAAAQVGNGPMTHNPLVSARKRYAPYTDLNFGVNVQSYASGTTSWSSTVMTTADHTYASADSPLIPEFIDRFPDAMPIVYLRARAGAPSFAGGVGSITMDATTQYNPALIYPYVKNNNASGFPGRSEDVNNNNTLDGGEDTNANGRLDYDFSNDSGSTASAGVYFRNPGVPTEVRQKDGFWLIGAGPDRKYGTKDDQTNFGRIQ